MPSENHHVYINLIISTVIDSSIDLHFSVTISIIVDEMDEVALAAKLNEYLRCFEENID